MRLLDKGGHALLTTNAVAETAGVSIGTLYQYFPNKEAILDALAAREVAALDARVVAMMEDPRPMSPQERVAGVVRAVSAGYGGRDRVHRLVMEHSLGRGSRKLSALLERLIQLMTSNPRPGPNGAAAPMSLADAFVATHAFVGVMRAMIGAQGGDAPAQAEIEQAMARMLTRFMGYEINRRS